MVRCWCTNKKCEGYIKCNESPENFGGGGGYDAQPRRRQRSPIKVGKAVPLHAWSGPEGSRKLRFPDFKTTAQDCGKVVSLKRQPSLPPGNTPGTHFC